MLYAPKHRLYDEVSFHPGTFRISLASNSVWGLRTGGPDLENYSLLNGRVGYTLSLIKRCPIDIFCKVDNITACRYEIMQGFPMPRCTAMAGLEIRF